MRTAGSGLDGAVDARRHWTLIFAVLTLAALTYSLFQSVMVPALPKIEQEVGASPEAATWLITGYLISASVATPIAGNLGDLFGKRRILVLALLACAVGTVIAAVGDSIGMLLLGRIIQGIAGAVFPLSFGIIRDEFPERLIPGGIAMISSILGIGGVFGITLAGPIIDNLSYHWLFWFPLVIVVLAALGAALFIPESPTRRAAKVDWSGALLLALWLTTLMVAISQGESWGWGSAAQLALVLVAVVVFWIWLQVQRRSKHPMVDLGMVSKRPVWTANAAGLCFGYCLFSSLVLVPQLVEAPTTTGFGLGASVSGAGIYLLPSTVAMIFMGPIAGWIAARWSTRAAMLIGSAFSFLAFAGLAFAHETAWHIYVTSFVSGVGTGLAYSSLPNLIVAAVPNAQTGTATGLNVVTRNIGGALGSQVSVAIVGGAGVGALASNGDFTIAFGLAMLAPVVGAVVMLQAPRSRPSEAAVVERSPLAQIESHPTVP